MSRAELDASIHDLPRIARSISLLCTLAHGCRLMHPFPPTAATMILSFFTLAVFYCSSDPSLTLPSPPYIPPKVIMDIADMIIEDFLYQNVFTTYDYFCPLPKSVSLCEHRSCLRIASQTSNARHSSFSCCHSVRLCYFLFLSPPSSLFKSHQSLSLFYL